MEIIKHIFLIVVVALFVGCNDDDHTETLPNKKQIVLNVTMTGEALGKLKTIVHPLTGETLEPNCFLLDLRDSNTDKVIGTLQECIVDNVVPGNGTITSKVIMSINLHGQGSLLAENLVLYEIQTPLEEFNFWTSSNPNENNAIGTGNFKDMVGKVSLEGEVNMAKMNQGIITFNHQYTIILESDEKQLK